MQKPLESKSKKFSFLKKKKVTLDSKKPKKDILAKPKFNLIDYLKKKHKEKKRKKWSST